MEKDRNSPQLVNDGAYDTVGELVIPFLTDSRDREAVSVVCRRWYQIDVLTRKHVTIALCYTVLPGQLSRRFPYLESLKLKGKPRAAMFNLIPENWGGYVRPWVEEIVQSFCRLKSIHFRRMIVTDADLELLGSCKGRILEVLKLDKCSGFSTDGLLHITRACRSLRILFLEESAIVEKDGEWLHEIALNNKVLQHLNFYMTDLLKIRLEDLEMIARNCPLLVSLKISDCEVCELIGFFRAARALEEFCGGTLTSLNVQPELLVEDLVNGQQAIHVGVPFPPKLCHLGLTFLENEQISFVFPLTARLKKLDLLYTLIDTEGHCILLQRCPNLEILEARNVMGDRGLEVVASFCKRLKRLRIERGVDEEGIISHTGLIALAQGCTQLEHVAVYVSDVTNEALECFGNLKDLCDFRLVLLQHVESKTDFPLDSGVCSLLRGCDKLRRLALYLRPGGLTDVGLGYIGQFSKNIRWMLLGRVGESDEGIIAFSKGCPRLQKLEMRDCYFSEGALATAILQLKCLRYFWVQGYKSSGSSRDLLAMVRPFWNIELWPAKKVACDDGNGVSIKVTHPAHILAYYSLAGRRTDFPETVFPLRPDDFLDN